MNTPDSIDPPVDHGEKLAPEPLLWKTKEAAAALGISDRLPWSMTNCGEIPCVRIGRCVRYSPDELREWIKARKGKRH